MPTDLKDQVLTLQEKVKASQLPKTLEERVLEQLERVGRLGEVSGSFEEFDRVVAYIDWLINLPWSQRSEDILDLQHVKGVLDKHHYGLQEIKDRVLEFIAVMKLNQGRVARIGTMRAPILCFVGLVGTGKTTIASSIAEALGRKFDRIPFGGMGDVLDLRGRSRVYPEAEPGRIIKAMRQVGVKNPVVLLDEIDRVADEGRSSIMGVLVELLDPEQNHAFLDHYIDFPFDLSQVLFVTTANNTTNISTAVLDRLEVIHMPSYTDEEKITIGKSYMLPKIINESGLSEDAVVFDDDIWSTIVRPLGYDAGMRTLERTVEGIVRKIAREVVEGKYQTVRITGENLKAYLPSY